MPQNAAGWRIDPPVSVPVAAGTRPAATAAAEPPDEPTGDAIDIPRVGDRAEKARLVGGPHRELVHVRLADHDRSGRAQPCDDGRVVG